MANDAPKYSPDAVKSPGQLLKETLKDMGVSIPSFRQKAGIEKEYYYQFLDGKAPMSEELAIRLERWAKLPKWLWDRHEDRWQEYQQVQEETNDQS